MHTRTTLPPCKTERRTSSAPRPRRRGSAPAAATFAASLSVGAFSTALANPTGGTVVQGQGSISTPASNSTVIDQASQHLQLNWSSFNVGASESVQFNQPSSTAVALNRILDQNPSQIFGSLKANGQVVLVNPNGLLIGRTAQLNVNSLVVSSLDAIDFDAASGRYRFATSRNDIGAILNEGSITAGPGGSVTLLGGRVSNSGTIVADLGTVNLAAGRAATLDLAGDGLLRLEVNSDLLSNGGGSSAVENSGSIQANGGQVLLTANAVNDVFANLINNTGVVRANRIDNSGGSIRLVGPEGIVQSSGVLDASAGDAISTGGSVAVLGDRVGLTGDAVIDVSGATGGGTALIGGDYQGKNPNVLSASRTYVGSGVTLNADAGTQGDGGRIIVWSDDATHYEGHLSARGGSLWGNGGFAEVSGKQTLTFAGTASLRAAHGQWGTLLLDPGSITIENSNDPPPSGITSPGDLDWATGENPGAQTIGNQTIEALLLDGSLALHATNDISQNANAPIDVSGQVGADGNSLTLEAVNGDITLRAGISTRNGDIVLQAGNDIVMQDNAALSSGTGDITLNADGNIQTRTISGRAVSLDAGGDIFDNGGTGLSAILGLSLHADHQIGELTDLLTLTDNTPVPVVTAGSVTATVDDSDGLINLRLPSTLPGGLDVTLGSGANRTGTVLLQSSGILNTTGFGAGAIKIGTGQTATVALISDSTLTLPAAGNLIDQSPGTLLLCGNDIVDSDAGAGSHSLTLDAQNLRFEVANPTASKFLTTTATRFDGVFGSSNALTVSNVGAPLTIGTVTAPNATLALQGQRLLDDGDTNTVIEGSQVTMSGQSVGTSANPMNTRAALLGATAAQGGIYIVEQDGVLLLGATAMTGGAGAGIVNIRTLDGAMEVLGADADTGVFLETAENIASASGITLTGSIQGNGAGVFLRTTGSGDGITLNGNIQNGGAVSLIAGSPASRGAITGFGNIDGSSLTILAASAGTGTSGRIQTSAGTLNITTTNAAQGAYIDATNGVTALTANASGVLDVRATNGSITADNASAGQGVFLQTDDPNQSITVRNGATVSGSVGGVSLNAAGIGGSIVVDGDVSGDGPGVQMTTGATGNITVNGQVSSNTAVNLTAGTPGSRGDIIAGASSLVTVTGATGLLTATGHSIGTSGARLKTSAIALNATAENGGDIYVQETNAVDLTATAIGGGTVDVLAGGVLSTVGTVSGNGVVLTTSGGGSNINVTGALNGNGGLVHLNSSAGVALTGAGLVNNVGGNVELDAVGAVTAQANTNRIIANQLTADAVSIGTSSARLFTEVGTLTTTTTSAAPGAGTYITEFDAVTLSGQANGGVLDVETTNGTLNETAANGGSGVRLVAGQTGNLTITGAVTGGTGPVTLAASGAGGTINLNNTVSTSGAAGDVTITAGTLANRGALNLGATSVTGDEVTIDAASIGASGAPLQTTARTLTASSTTAGIFVRDTDGLTVNSATAAVGEVNIETQNGALSVGATAGDGVTLKTSGANNTITTTGVINGRAGPVLLTTNGVGAGIAVNGGITTSNTTTLSATAGGNIGINSGVSGSNVLATASAGGITGNGNVTASNDITLTAAANIALGGALGAGGDFALTTTAGTIDIGDVAATNATLSAGGSAQFNGAFSVANDLAVTAGGNVGIDGALVAGHNATVNTTGNIAGTGSVSAVDLTLTGASIGTTGSHLDTAASALHLTSSNGSIFVDELDAVTLDATAIGGEVNVQATNGALTLGSITASNGVSLTSGGANQDFNVNQAVNAGSGGLTFATTGAGSAINLNAAVSAAGPVNVNAGGAGGSIAVNNTVTTPGAVTLTAGTAGNRGTIEGGAGALIDSAALTATGASIGSNARLETKTGTLTATSSTGGVFVSEADALTITGTSAAGLLDVQAIGALTVNAAGGNGVVLIVNGAGNAIDIDGPVTGGTGNITLLANGDGSNINLGGAITTTGNVSLTAGTVASRGAIDTSGGGGSVTGNALTAVGSSIGSSGIALFTNVNSLDATATNGNIRVSEANGLDLTAGASGAGSALEVTSATGPVRVGAVSADGVTIDAGGTLTVDGPMSGGTRQITLNTLGDMTLNGAVSTNNVVALNGGDGAAINLNSAVSGTEVQVNIGSAGARGSLVAGAGNLINADNLVLRTAGVGDSSSRLNTAVNSIDALSASGGIYVTEADALSLEALAQGGGAVDVRTLNGALTAGSVAGAMGVALATGGDGNALTVNGGTGGGVQGGGSNVSLTTSGAGSNIVLNASVQANPNVTIAANGDGSSVILNDVIGSASVSITAGSATNRGAIVGGAASNVAADSVTLVGSTIGSGAARVNTAATTLNATSTNGGIFLSELDAVGLTANATGGAVDVETLGLSGALTVAAATGDGVSLKSGSLGGISVAGAVNGGAGPVTLTATASSGAIALNSTVTTSGAVTLTTGGAITAGAGSAINAGSLTASGSSIGTSGARLNTNVGTLNATSTGGDIFVTDANALTLSATASNALDVQTTSGALTVTGATGTGITLAAGGAGSGIAINGAVNAGTGNVTLTAGAAGSRGAIATGAGGRVTARVLTAEGSSIGSSSAPLNTTVTELVANATSGDVGISELDGLSLTNVRATGNVVVSTGAGDIAVSTVNAGNDATLTAASGAITDDTDDTTRVTARNVTLQARSIGGPSTLTGTTLDSKPRLDLDATSLDATASAGGIFIDELNGLSGVSVHASGAGSDIELLTATGDLNLQSVSASDTLLLAAGGNINALAGLGPVTARAAELRAGGADSAAGHIGTLSAPLTLQLDAGNTLRLFVPQTVNPTDAARAPATLPSNGALTTLSLFGSPSPLSVQAGFGQFTGQGDSQFTSPAESLVRTIQNQTTNVQTVLGLDWASFDPNVSLFGTLDPSVCLPADQRDEEKGDSGC